MRFWLLISFLFGTIVWSRCVNSCNDPIVLRHYDSQPDTTDYYRTLPSIIRAKQDSIELKNKER